MPIEFQASGLIRVVAAGALVTASAGVFAANLGFLNNTPITLKQRDLQALNRAAQVALDTKQDGESMDWNNKGRRQLGTDRRHGDAARQFRSTRHEVPQDHARRARAKGQMQTWSPSACKHSDGKWQLLKQ